MNKIKKFFNMRDKNTSFKLIFAFVLGLFLLITSSMPNKNKEQKEHLEKQQKNIYQSTDLTDNYSYEKNLESRLENLLSNVDGVGNVKVMITLSYGKEIVIADDINSSLISTKEIDKSGTTRETQDKKTESKKIIIDGKDPLILKEIQPKVEGVIIIAEGGDDIYIKQELIKSAQTILNVDAHKIQVLKMRRDLNKNK